LCVHRSSDDVLLSAERDDVAMLASAVLKRLLCFGNCVTEMQTDDIDVELEMKAATIQTHFACISVAEERFQ
jgi:hypothetical protein